MEKLNFNDDTLLYALKKESDLLYAVPPICQPKKFMGADILWVISADGSKSLLIKTKGEYKVEKSKGNIAVTFNNRFEVKEFEGFPCCDFLGNRFSYCIDGDSKYQDAAACFYWKSLVAECAERTFMRKNKRWRDGYVLSTLKLSKYAGTYPAVDHEFHIRGRMAMGGAFDLGLVKRMMLLQIKTMKTDLRGKNRIPCSVQPNGKREYHITRKSIDKSVKARMFPITGVIELCEEIYNYYTITKDIDFVRDNISMLEKGLEYAESFLDDNGRLFADVYYEDQVMKDGATAQAQAFASNSFYLMSKLEALVKNEKRAEYYRNLADKMKANYILTVPNGYWDEENQRYVDWIDRDGNIHDHIHLLSNVLSVTYGFNNSDRDEKIKAMINDNNDIFQKFPSFVAAKIEDYTNSEIGDGGPYDLCAAGRYWCHDSKYRRSINDAHTIKEQLEKVYNQAASDNFEMGERYDMNYIYYNTGKDAEKNWHGAPLYYEYPNVFLDVLVHDFFGILADEDTDLLIAPCCTENSSITMESFGISYNYSGKEFRLANISDKSKKIKIDLSKITEESKCKTITLKPNESYIYKKD